jgi:SAM-dependent methyltransferase
MLISIDDFYTRTYDRLYRLGYHRKPDYSHAKALAHEALTRLKPTSVLDVGCSNGWTMEFFGMHGIHASGVDVSPTAVAHARRLGRDARLASATALPFADQSFDLVLSTDCLEHMRPQDATTAVHQLARVARRDIAIKVNPRQDRNRWWKWIAGTPLHLTCRPVATWLAWFRHCGFTVSTAFEQREEFLLTRTAPTPPTPPVDAGDPAHQATSHPPRG